MSSPTRSNPAPASSNLCDLFLRELNSLILTNRSITSSLLSARTEFASSPEIVRQINELVAVGQEGENHLRQPMEDAEILPPRETQAGPYGMVASLHSRNPLGSGDRATEVIVNLRLLAQHLELRARLAAEEARLVGHKALRRALLAWAAEWYVCGQNLRSRSPASANRPETPVLGEPVLQRS